MAELEAAVPGCIARHNQAPKRFVWSKTADSDLGKHRAILSTNPGDETRGPLILQPLDFSIEKLVRQVRIDHGRTHFGVTQDALQREQTAALSEEVRCEGVPQTVPAA